MNGRQYVFGALALIIVAGGSFWGGMHYANAQPAGARGVNGQYAGGGMGTRGGRTGGGFTAGTVVSVDPTTITLQAQNGSSENVFYTASTTVLKTSSGSVGDLKAGTTIVVTGTPNSDGSVTAQSVQIRPAGMTASSRPQQ